MVNTMAYCKNICVVLVCLWFRKKTKIAINKRTFQPEVKKL